MDNSLIRKIISLGIFSIMVATAASCGGGGGGGSSSNNGSPKDGPPPPLAYYLSLTPSTSVNGEAVSPAEVVAHEPESGSFTRFTRIAGDTARLDAFHRINDDVFYFSVNQHAEVNGVALAPGDIGLSDNASISIAFDASAAGLPDGVNVDAVTRAPEGDFILSSDIHFAAGGETFEDADLVRYDGNVFSLFRSAGELGLDDRADIDAVTLRANGDLVLSLETSGTATGPLAYASADLLLATETEGITSLALAAGTELATGASVNALSDNR